MFPKCWLTLKKTTITSTVVKCSHCLSAGPPTQFEIRPHNIKYSTRSVMNSRSLQTQIFWYFSLIAFTAQLLTTSIDENCYVCKQYIVAAINTLHYIEIKTKCHKLCWVLVRFMWYVNAYRKWFWIVNVDLLYRIWRKLGSV